MGQPDGQKQSVELQELSGVALGIRPAGRTEFRKTLILILLMATTLIGSSLVSFAEVFLGNFTQEGTNFGDILITGNDGQGAGFSVGSISIGLAAPSNLDLFLPTTDSVVVNSSAGVVVGSGVLSLHGGTLLIGGLGNLSIGANSAPGGGAGVFNQSPETSVNVGGTVVLGFSASGVGFYTLFSNPDGSGAGTLSAGSMVIGGAGQGTYNQNGGNVAVNQTIRIGAFTSSSVGAYNLNGNGANLTAASLTVGDFGQGTFNQNPPSQVTVQGLAVGAQQGSHGLYVMNGGGGH